jgi:hypothetical protein
LATGHPTAITKLDTNAMSVKDWVMMMMVAVVFVVPYYTYSYITLNDSGDSLG